MMFKEFVGGLAAAEVTLALVKDDGEPPKQNTVMPGGKVTAEMVNGWLDFLL
jgi:hypothetical protein